MKASALLCKILSFLIFLSMANAGQLYSYQERVIICMVPLEHADAEQLANVLAPFLSPQGKIVAYSPTNTLIIKDQPSVVKMLIKVIKGPRQQHRRPFHFWGINPEGILPLNF